MERIIKFLQDLQLNNNREWFNAHKAQYIECKALFDDFTERLIAGIREFDSLIGPLSAKECTYRIYRDVRFSADKSPYKTHFGAFVVPGGKKSGYSGYYLQVGARDRGFPGGCMLAAGNYFCEPKVLRILREDIAYDSRGAFGSAVEAAKGFELDFDGALKKVPSGFAADKPYSNYLRLKNFCLVKEPGLSYMAAPDMLEQALADFRTTVPFIHFINRAISFSREED